MKSKLYIRLVSFVTNDINWCGSCDDVLVLILFNEIEIQDGERCGDAKQANNQNILPHAKRHEEHEHDVRTAGHCECHQGQKKMGVLPHIRALKGLEVAYTNPIPGVIANCIVRQI